MSHRGPDAEGVFLNEFLNLNARRLRIHDLNEKADQPFRDPKDNYAGFERDPYLIIRKLEIV